MATSFVCIFDPPCAGMSLERGNGNKHRVNWPIKTVCDSTQNAPHKFQYDSMFMRKERTTET